MVAELGGHPRHLAVRFCAKEAVAKALALRDGGWHDVEVLGGGDGPPAVRAERPRRRARRRARGGARRAFRSPTPRGWPRRWRCCDEQSPLARAAAGRGADARHRRVGDRGARHPVARADGARGGGARARGRRARARGPDRRRLREGQQRRRRAGRGAAAARRGPRGRGAARVGGAVAERGRQGDAAPGSRAPRPSPTTPRGSSARTGSSTRCSARAPPARRRTRSRA